MPRLNRNETAGLLKRQRYRLSERQAADRKLESEAAALTKGKDGLVEVKSGGKKYRVDPLRAAKILQLAAIRKSPKNESE